MDPEITEYWCVETDSLRVLVDKQTAHKVLAAISDRAGVLFYRDIFGARGHFVTKFIQNVYHSTPQLRRDAQRHSIAREYERLEIRAEWRRENNIFEPED